MVFDGCFVDFGGRVCGRGRAVAQIATGREAVPFGSADPQAKAVFWPTPSSF